MLLLQPWAVDLSHWPARFVLVLFQWLSQIDAAKEAALLTYFVVQSFRLTPKGAITPGDATEVQDIEHALRLAEKLAASSAGVVAFSRTGDPSTGELEDAVILYANGAVPLLESELAIAC
ncbi:MAG: hypothetical protein E5X93_27865 [Mesorhizobium sp.]|uniref:hypothetical protein n=1 Tax=Mesorhizobium sp. TaxID=1871066 RepID=UPI00120F2B78|nr:hypothetical protein [Mesorhizobium sp.]TIO11505.1 MAG: hypothetical protein E5X93_27865 [Mesorhizobium sp.]